MNRIPGICAFQDCDQRTPRKNYPLCRDHHNASEAGEIDECPNCSQYKLSGFPVCTDCYTEQANRTAGRICAFQDCDQRTPRKNYPLCRDHHNASEAGEIDECPNCSQYKLSGFPVCTDCYTEQANRTAGKKYAVESSPKWDTEKDAEAAVFYVYILRLAGGKFYVGHTRELRERLSEHKDGKTRSTKDKNPRLVWFTELRSREEATHLEADLKKVNDRNQRKIRRMVVQFKDLAEALDFTEG